MHRNKLIVMLVVANILDLVLTLVWIHSGIGYEANPIMAALLTLGLPYFIGAKLFITTGGALVFYLVEYTKTLFYTLVVLNMLYAIILCDHAWIFTSTF